jgi:hypothetical protein
MLRKPMRYDRRRRRAPITAASTSNNQPLPSLLPAGSEQPPSLLSDAVTHEPVASHW